MIEKLLLKKIWILAFPVLITNLLQTSVTAIDTLMIGRLGPIPIAAVGMGNTIRFLLLILVMSVAGGAISLIAQAKGSRDPQRMSFVTRQSLVSGLLLSLALALLGILLARPLLVFMNSGGDPEAVKLGYQYLFVLFLGTPFLVLNFVANRLMQGAGDTFTPLVLTLGIVLLNIAFNFIFIFGWGPVPAYGVVGAALGTIVARAIAVFIAMVLFHSGKNIITILPGSWKPHMQMIKDILSIGLPSGIQGLFRHGGVLVVTALATASELGTYGAAVLAIGFQIEQLAIQPIVGVNVAATSLVGQQIGKWQIREAFNQGNIMVVAGIAAMSILVLPMVLFSKELILLFDPSANATVLEGGLSFFRINMVFLPIVAIAVVLSGALRGTGDTRPAMRSSIINRNILTIAAAWLLAFPLEMGSSGIWWGIVIGRMADTAYLGLVWIQKKWMRVALEKTVIFRTHLQHLSDELMHKFLREIRTPLMAIPQTLEVVKADKVIYKNPKEETLVNFTQNGFKIIHHHQ